MNNPLNMNVYILRINNQSNKYFQVIQEKKKKKEPCRSTKQMDFLKQKIQPNRSSQLA